MARSTFASTPLEARFPWRYRRIAVFWTLALCSAGVIYLTLWGTDSRLNETLALGYFGLLASTVGSYVFGAVWHDKNLMQSREATPQEPEPVE
jgi:hypothetical protein